VRRLRRVPRERLEFRVIVAQNALGDRDACVLLDTRASDSPPAGLGISLIGSNSIPPRSSYAPAVDALGELKVVCNGKAWVGRSNGTPLESVTEEEHTSGLLFPDASLLRRSNTPSKEAGVGEKKTGGMFLFSHRLERRSIASSRVRRRIQSRRGGTLRRSNTHAFPLQTTFNSPNASTAGAYDDRGGMELDRRYVPLQSQTREAFHCFVQSTPPDSESTRRYSRPDTHRYTA
jgi:hypothetical protein